MKAELIKSQSNTVRFTFDIPKKDVVTASKLPLVDPFVILDSNGKPVFRLQIGPEPKLSNDLSVITLPLTGEAKDKPAIVITFGSNLTEEETRYQAAIYAQRLTTIETQITTALANAKTTADTVKVV